MTLTEKLNDRIRDVKDFPKEGILFKDITPVLMDAELCDAVIDAIADEFRGKVDAVAGVESRGFLFGMGLASKLGIPFIPIRKVGKLPYNTISHKYELEYGFAEIEVHTDAVSHGQRVLIHDDLLATGGTAAATAELINKLGGHVAGFSFIIDLAFLNGSEVLKKYNEHVHALVRY